MTIFSFISLFGGLALFLYGMNVLSSGLEKITGGKTESALKKLTSNRFKGLLFGTAAAAVIQSSSAVTVMLVGLVNSGIMDLSQAISITMGSNVGTTVTAWILSLMGISSDNIFINLLKPSNFSPIVAFIGVIMIFAGKKQKHKDAGSILVGFAILMYGMTAMSGSVEALTEMPGFTRMFVIFKNPIAGVLIGVVFTAIVQSSAASIGVLQALSMTGSITYSAAIPIIMGQNIGTCVSAIIASFGTSKNAKRVAVAHLMFNAIGTAVALSGWLIADAICDFAFADQVVEPYNIAVLHSIFNIFTTVLLFPLAGVLEKFVKVIVRDAKNDEQEVLLEDRLMTVPSFAVAKAASVTASMASLSKKTVKAAVALLDGYDEKAAENIAASEKTIDRYEDELGTYLVKLSKKEVTDADSKQIAKLLHTISDFERIGDHAINIMNVAKEMAEKKISFSDDAKDETDNLTDAVFEILSITVKAFKTDDIKLAGTVEPLEEVIDDLVAEIKARHIARLTAGECTIELGFVLTDLLTNYERIADHCSNIAVAVIEAQREVFDSHEYLRAVKKEKSGSFSEYYEVYKNKYNINI